MPLSTDAWVFLNARHPLCAWATYRGSLVCPPAEPGLLSVWSAALLARDNTEQLGREFALENVRRQHYEHLVSRLRGMFCFLDLESAERALTWGGYFRPENLTELNLSEAGPRRDRFDAQWLGKAVVNEQGHVADLEWAHQYWRGEPCDTGTPIWETLVDGRAIVLGTAIRERAYSIIKQAAPDSLMLLEIARLAAWIGSDLGNVFAILKEEGDDLVLDFRMDMKDANDPIFLAKLDQLIKGGHPVNSKDMQPHIAAESFGKTPDLRRFGFRRPRIEFPYIGPARPADTGAA